MIREKRKFSNQPIGIVQPTEASASAETYKALGQMATSIAGGLYKQGVQEAEARGIAEAEQVVLPSIDDEGYFNTIELPNAGRIRQQAFDKTLKFKMEKDIDRKLRTVMTSLSADPMLQADPQAFTDQSSIKLEAIIKNATPELKAYTQQIGSNYQALGLLKVQKNQFAEQAKKTKLMVQEEALLSASQIGLLLQQGSPDEAMAIYKEVGEFINNTNELSVPDKREYKSYMRIEFLNGMIANHTRSMNRQQMLVFKKTFLGDRANLPEGFNEVIQELGVNEQDIDSIARYLNQLVGVADEAPKAIQYGNKPATRVGLDTLFDSTLTDEDSGTMGSFNWRDPRYKGLVVQYGAIPQKMFNLLDSLAKGTRVDSDGSTGYEAYKFWENFRTEIGPNGFMHFDNDIFPKKFNEKMRVMSRYLDLTDNQDMYNKVWSEMHNNKIDYQSIGVSLGLDGNKQITKNNVMEAVRGQLVEHGTPIDMTRDMADRFVDETIMLMHVSQSGQENRNPMDINDAIDLVSDGMNNFYKHDEHIVSSGVRFTEEVQGPSGNINDVNIANNGTTLTDTGSEVKKLTNVRKTMFALDTTLQPDRHIGVKELFLKHAENLAIANGADEGSVMGDGVLLEVDTNSSLSNARYMIMAKQDGTIMPLMYKNTQVPIIVTTGDFIRTRYATNPNIQEVLSEKAFTIQKKQKGAKNVIGNILGNVITGFGRFGVSDTENALGGKIAGKIPDLPFIESSADKEVLKQFEANNFDMSTELPDDFYDTTFKQFTDAFDAGFFQKFSIKNGRPSFSGFGAIDRNNPLNIRLTDDKWVGKMDSPSNEFEAFDSMINGYRAGLINLKSYQKRMPNMNLSQMINTWAPPKGVKNDGTPYTNPTSNYLKFVVQQSNVQPDTVIDLADEDMMLNIFRAMTMFEIGESYQVQGGDGYFLPEIARGIKAGIRDL